MLTEKQHLTQLIKQKAQELGFQACGITDTSPFTEFLAALDERIRRYPEAAHLYEPLRDNGYPKKRAALLETAPFLGCRYRLSSLLLSLSG